MVPFAEAVTQAIISTTTKLALRTHALAAMELQQQEQLAHLTMVQFAQVVTQAITWTPMLAWDVMLITVGMSMILYAVDSKDLFLISCVYAEKMHRFAKGTSTNSDGAHAGRHMCVLAATELQQQERLALPTMAQFAQAATRAITSTTKKLALRTPAPALRELQQQELLAHPTMLPLA